MGTALLDEEVSVAEDEDVVWVSKENPPIRGGVWEEIAHGLRLAGHDAVAVGPEDDDFDFRQYIDPRILKRLDAVTLDENWRNKQE